MFSWNTDLGYRKPSKHDDVILYNSAFEQIFSATLVMSKTTYSSYGQHILSMESMTSTQPDSHNASILRSLYRGQSTLATLQLEPHANMIPDPYDPNVWSFEWNACLGLLLLASHHLSCSIAIYYKQRPELPWHRRTLPDERIPGLCRHIQSAAWSPDACNIVLLCSEEIVILSTSASACLSHHRLDSIHPGMIGSRETLVRVSPDDSTLAFFDARLQVLVLYNIQSCKAVTLSKYTTQPAYAQRWPTSIAWNAVGDELTMLRGDVWETFSFGDISRTECLSSCRVNLLEHVNSTAGFPPSDKHASGVCDSGCCELPDRAASAEPGNFSDSHLYCQLTLGCCPGWVDDSWDHPYHFLS